MGRAYCNEQTADDIACTVAVPFTQENAMRQPASRLISRFAGMLMTLAAMAIAWSAHAAEIYRWVDKQGKTHFGDAVPSEYKDVAKPVANKATAPSAQEQGRALERAAQEKEQARADSVPKPAPTAAASAPSTTAAPVPAAQKRPPSAPDAGTDCESWRRLYRESLDCFGPYRTARGATKAEAFDRCTAVAEQPARCGRDAQ